MTDQESPKTEEAEKAARARSFEVTSIHTNLFYLSTLNGWVRIGFAEVDPLTDHENYHSAIMLSPANALELADLIQKFVVRVAPGGAANG